MIFKTNQEYAVFNDKHLDFNRYNGEDLQNGTFILVDISCECSNIILFKPNKILVVNTVEALHDDLPISRALISAYSICCDQVVTEKNDYEHPWILDCILTDEEVKAISDA